MTVGLCGDLKFGRTVHSLVNAMKRYPNVKFVFISPEELSIPQYLREELTIGNFNFEEVRTLEDVIGDLDILYMTRVQKERFFNEDEYLRLKNSFILDKKKLSLAKEDMYVLHPLPRVNEITVEVDEDPRAAYFKQVQNGVYIRMALILILLACILDILFKRLCGLAESLAGDEVCLVLLRSIYRKSKRCNRKLSVLGVCYCNVLGCSAD